MLNLYIYRQLTSPLKTSTLPTPHSPNILAQWRLPLDLLHRTPSLRCLHQNVCSHILTCILAPRSLPHNCDCSLLQKDFKKTDLCPLVRSHGVSDTSNSTVGLTAGVSFPSHTSCRREDGAVTVPLTDGRCALQIPTSRRGPAKGRLCISCARWDCYTPAVHGELFVHTLTLQSCALSAAKVEELCRRSTADRVQCRRRRHAGEMRSWQTAQTPNVLVEAAQHVATQGSHPFLDLQTIQAEVRAFLSPPVLEKNRKALHCLYRGQMWFLAHFLDQN